MLFLVWRKNSQNILKCFSASSGQNWQRPGSRLEGVPPGVSLRLSLNHSSSPGQKRCTPALHSNVELNGAQFHSLWFPSLGSGTVWYNIAGRSSGLCKQPHSTCNREEREKYSFSGIVPPCLLACFDLTLQQEVLALHWIGEWLQSAESGLCLVICHSMQLWRAHSFLQEWDLCGRHH